MAKSNPSWAVVATVDEHPALIKTFVAWHLWLGAREIYLYFDRADDPAADLFAGMPQVKVTRCDQSYWERHAQTRPVRHQIRQNRNATRAYRRTEAEWLLHIDADEFLWPSQSVGDHLDKVYPWMDAAIVPVAERVFVKGEEAVHVFQGSFRRPEKGAAGEGITARGLTGHAIGKAFSRVGTGMSVSVHRPQRRGDDIKTAPVEGLELLHFDGLTRLQWVYKLLRKADAYTNHGGMEPSPHRQKQIDAVLGDPAKAFALHDELKVLSSDKIEALRAQGLLLAADFDPSKTLQAAFGTSGLLEPDAFDDWLMAEKADGLPQLKSVS